MLSVSSFIFLSELGRVRAVLSILNGILKYLVCLFAVTIHHWQCGNPKDS